MSELHALILAEIVLAYPEALTVAEIFARVGRHFAPAALLEFARAIRHMEDAGLLTPVAVAGAAATVVELKTEVAEAKATGTYAQAAAAENKSAATTSSLPTRARRCVRTAVTRQGREYLFSLLIAGALPDEAQRKLADGGLTVAALSPENGGVQRPCNAQQPFAEKESVATDPLQKIRIAEPGPTAHAAPHGTHAHGKSGDAASKLPSPLPIIAPTALEDVSHEAPEQSAVRSAKPSVLQDIIGQTSAHGERGMSGRTQPHAPVRDSHVSLIERYLPELYAPQRTIVDTRSSADMNASALNASTSYAAQTHDHEISGAASRTTQLHGRERNTPAQHDCGPHSPESGSGPAIELCESCGGPAQRQCPCGAQRCASHFYDAEGAQAQGARGFCAECVDIIREQQYGEERYGVAGGA